MHGYYNRGFIEDTLTDFFNDFACIEVKLNGIHKE